MSLTGDLSVDKDYIIHTHMRDYFRSNERCQLRRGRRIIKLAFFLFFFFCWNIGASRCKSYQSRASEPFWFISNIWLRNSFRARFDSCVRVRFVCLPKNDKADFSLSLSLSFNLNPGILAFIETYTECVMRVATFWNKTRLSRSYSYRLLKMLMYC